MLRFDVITLFPEMFAGVLGHSILKRAAETVPDPAVPDDPDRARPPVASYHLHQLRDFSTDAKHHKVDKPPFGGGPGMVLQCQPLWDAVRHVESIEPEAKPHRVLLTPTGRPFTQRVAEELSQKDRLLLICGHYEGFDQRVLDALQERGGLDEVSVGDVVLSGGELPAMTVIDAVVRLLPGALGDTDSARHDSFSPGVHRLLDHPHYTQPAEWHGRTVPDVLRSGDHAAIARWREEALRRLTEARRPDLLTGDGTGDPPVVIVREAALRGAPLDAAAAVVSEALGGAAGSAVRGLHESGEATISVIAECRGEVIGHAVASEVVLTEEPGVRGLLLMWPVAVRPLFRGRGVGAALVRECVHQARQAGVAWLFATAEAPAVQRHGFGSAAALGFSADEVSTDRLLVLNLRPNKTFAGGRLRLSVSPEFGVGHGP